MFTQKRIFNSLVLFIVVSFILVGCVRPFSSEGGETEATPTADPNQGGGVDQPVAESSAEQPTAEAETQPEEEMAEGTAVSEETAVEETTTETSPAETTEEIATTETSQTATPTAESTTTETTETTTTTETQTTEQTTQESNTTSQTSPVAPTTATGTCPVTHTVQAGQNLYRIGLQYGISWVPIAQANGLANPNAIYAGQVLIIPVAGCAPVPPPQPPGQGTTYVVQPGDNLFRIGLKFGVSWVQIAEANGIVNPNQIYAGQVLKIPTAQPGPTPNFTHLVRRGETLYTISIHYGVPWQAIAAANQIPPPYIVYAGQTIIIPGTW